MGTTAVNKVSTSLESLFINDVYQIMKNLQRAVVLAWRGKHWTLLQNVARTLWNTVQTLLQACSSKLEPQRKDPVLAAVYGLSLKPLYFASRGLVELLETVESSEGGRPVLEASSLHFVESADDCNSVGKVFVKQLVFLAVHVLYAHQHWEKAVDIALRFDDVTQ